MRALPPSALDQIARQHGVINRDALRQVGLTSSAIDRRRRSGVLESVHPGVFRLAGSSDSLEQRLAALCLSISNSVVSHTSAARLWGLRRIPDLGIQITVPSTQTPEVLDVRVHRTNCLTGVDIVERDDAIRLTSPPRTAFDLASILDPDALGSVFEQLIDERKW